MQQDRIAQLKQEITSFLPHCDLDNKEDVLILCAYRLLLRDTFLLAQVGFSHLSERIQATINQIAQSKLIDYFHSIDFDVLFDDFDQQYEQYKGGLIPKKEVVDVGVHILLLFDGYVTLSGMVRKSTDKLFYTNFEKRYRFGNYDIVDEITDEYFGRYMNKESDDL